MKIDRRRFTALLSAAGGAACSRTFLPRLAAQTVASQTSAMTRWARIAAQKQEATSNVTWLTREPIEFLLRRGTHDADEPAHYPRMLDPGNLKRMAAAGVQYGLIFFYKGFGLDYERNHMEQARHAADIMHSLGMKVSLYVGGTMFTETFYRETPEAVNWEQRDQWNHWVSYGMQTYRHYACPNEPAYRDYIKRVLKIGLEDLHADEIAFDNIMLQTEPHSCRCPRCLKAFAAFLKRRYPSAEASFRRFGYPDTSWIRPNEWESNDQPQSLQVLDDPVLQEWVRFRCETLANYSIDLYDYVKSVSPQTAVSFNIKGVYSFNRYWTNAVYQPLFAGRIDQLVFDTEGYNEHIDAHTGALVSQIRSYKMARRLGTSCFDAFSDDIRASVHMAFGYQKPGCVPAPSGAGAFRTFTPLLEFFREYNARYYTGTENIADVAILRSWPTMAYSISAAYIPATLMEQVLIQYKVPFDLLFDEQMQNLGRYKAIVLSGQECVSDAQAELLTQYVRQGGTLMLVGNNGIFNEWRELRSSDPFPAEGAVDRGQVVRVAAIVRGDNPLDTPNDFTDPEPGAVSHYGSQLAPSQWVLPKNHVALHDALIKAIPDGLTITTDAPLTTVMEILRRPESQETILHFVNFDTRNRLAAFAVRLRREHGAMTHSVTCFNPDQDDPIKIAFSEDHEVLKFEVPSLTTYGMVVIA
jgi:hypothetical protein